MNALHTAFGREFVHDTLGRVAEARDSNRNRYESYGYDAAGRLTSWGRYTTSSACTATDTTSELGSTCTTGNGTITSATYTYDLLGNWNGTGDTVATGSRQTASGGWHYDYDADGNLTRRFRSGFDQYLYWNSANELDSVRTQVGGGSWQSVTFGYDAFGRRVRKTTGSGTTYYIWSGDQVAAEYSSGGTLLRHYTYYAGTDRPHSMYNGSQRYFYAMDGRANVTGLTDSVGAEVARYRYTPYGDTAATTGSVSNAIRFAGRELDTETGLYYNRARYYDPQLGRFVSEDPIGLRGGVNPYVYAANDPITFSDPTGLYVFVSGRCAQSSIDELRDRSPTFKRLYDALYNAPTNSVYVVVRPARTERELGTMAAVGDNRGYSSRDPHSETGRVLFNQEDCDVHGNVRGTLAHEFVHVAGMYADQVNTGIPGGCGLDHARQQLNQATMAECREIELEIGREYSRYGMGGGSDWRSYSSHVLGTTRAEERAAARQRFIYYQ